MVQIEKLIAADAEACVHLLVHSFSKNYEAAPNPVVLKDPGAFPFVAKLEGTVVGYASLHIITKISRKTALIEDVAVSNECRGKGIGKKLVLKLVEVAKEQGCDKIILNSNEENIPFYEKIGFQKAEIQMIMRNSHSEV